MIDHIEERYLEPFARLANSISILLQDHITEDDLDKCELDLLYVVGKIQEDFGQVITYNIHCVLLIIESLRQTDPLFATSNFHFESNIFSLRQNINGPNTVEQ